MAWLKKILLAGLVAMLLVFAGVAWDVVQFGNQRNQARADAAVVLGAAAWGSRPSPVYRERINEAVLLYQQGRVRWIIFTGGTREPDFPSEGEVGRQYAAQHGVPMAAMLMDTESRTTWENLERARDLMAANHLQTALLVSDPLHMRRAVDMAQDMGLQVWSAPTASSRFRSWLPWGKFLWRETWLNLDYRVFGSRS